MMMALATQVVERVPSIKLAVSPDKPLDTLPPGIPDDYGIPTLGWGVLAFALPLFAQPNGPRAGEPFRPTDRQVRFMLWWYAVDEDGQFIFRHAVRRLAKGSGKSPFAAFLALCELCGPVRFSHWETADDGSPWRPSCWECKVQPPPDQEEPPDGWPRYCRKCRAEFVLRGEDRKAAKIQANCKPIGKRVIMPLVQIAATTQDQTKNTQRMVRAFAAKDTKLQKMFNLQTGITQVIKPGYGGGDLHVITSSPAAAEGAEPSCVVADETEYWLPSNSGDDLWEALDRNLAKSGSRMIETANAPEPGSGAIAEATWDAFVAQEEGRLRGVTRILYDCIEMPADVDWADPDSLMAGLAVVYADCPWADTAVLAERIWSPTTRPEVSRRFYGNQRVSGATKWTTQTKWAALADPTRLVPDDEEIVVFFDGSKSRDATALIGCCVSDGHIFEIASWEPDWTKGEEVDAAEVDRAVMLMRERWNVLAFFGDVKEWESYVKTAWPELFGDDLLIWAVPCGKMPYMIAWDMRANKSEFAQAAELCNSEIDEGKFTHDGSSVVSRHVVNMHARPYQQWVSVGKESPHSPRKIDAGICVIGVRMVRRLLLASKEYAERNKPRQRTGEYYAW